MISLRRPRHLCALTVALALALAPTRGDAIAPVLLLMLKQIARNAAESMIKDALLSGLDGIGCKGIALASALRGFDLRRGGGGGGGLAVLAGGMPRLPAGASAMPAAIPDMGALGRMGSMPGSSMGLGGGSAPPELLGKMQRLMPSAGELPSGAGLAPEQMALFADMQQAMSRPLSPPETVATIDELAELGFLPKPVQSELKECMVVLPTSIAALGMGMGMLKPMLPQLRQARAQMHALPPAEQDEVAAALATEISPLPAAQRSEFVEFLGSGFFPPRVVTGVKARLEKT